MSKENEIKNIYKPDKIAYEKTRKQHKKIQEIVKEHNIPYISSEEMAALL
ncbi:hypothetical protein [Succinivibrio dextrinosolvens]|nr:hypothetical protein [Succinivibrio dextrinosolvens]